jgi:cyclic pyranopterin phosphate synthase
VNVSLDTLQPQQYAHLTRGGDLSKTLAGIDAALEHGLTPVKLNAVVLRGANDDEVCDLVRFAAGRGCEMRFIELMPVGEAAPQHEELFVSMPEVRKRLEREFEFGGELSGPHAPARTFAVRSLDGDVSGVVGFIAPVSHPFCDGCRRLRLTSRGELLGCLMHGQGLDVRKILRSGEADAELERAVQSALDLKAAGLKMPRTASMATVGG